MYTIVFYVLTCGGIEAKPLGRPRVLLLIRRDMYFIVIRKTRYTFFLQTVVLMLNSKDVCVAYYL